MSHHQNTAYVEESVKPEDGDDDAQMIDEDEDQESHSPRISQDSTMAAANGEAEGDETKGKDLEDELKVE